MATAVLVADDIPGFPTPGTLYRIDPPLSGTDHLVLFYQPPMWGQHGQLNVILATPEGAVFGNDVRPQQGTYVTNEPNHYLALQLAGAYMISDPEPDVDESDIVVQQPPEPIPDPNAFGPSAHTVAEVLAYLDAADPAEQVRVLEAERNGKARKGILGEDVT